jgi:hypothetical protein
MQKILTTLSKNILATVTYYDSMDFPMTEFEVWKHLIRADYYAVDQCAMKIELEHVIKELRNKNLAAFLDNRNGFYFLKGRDEIVVKRIASTKLAAEKIRGIQSVVSFLRFIPFVRMVAITGRLAMKNARPQSDWDLLVVLKNKRIWIGRTLVTLAVHLIGKRRRGKKIADMVCLNYFVTDESLEVITKDLFSANEYTFLYPLFGWEVFKRFQINNKWIRSMKPNYDLVSICPLKTLRDSRISSFVRSFGELILNFSLLENVLKTVEKRKIMTNPKTTREGSLIYAHDDALVFLPDPHGPRLFEKFKEKIANFGL